MPTRLQVFDNWRILTGPHPRPRTKPRPPHALYGHVPGNADYSVGHWLREVAPLVQGGARPIIVGGTGLYFSALTEGLADIPANPRNRARRRQRAHGAGRDRGASGRDRRRDTRPDRLRETRCACNAAWEVLQTTGRGLADWQDDTPPPLHCPCRSAPRLVVGADKDWLNARIARRFDRMLDQGALEEARANLPGWTPSLLSAKAIGAPELIAHLRGEMTLDQAREAATIATRQFAKRQRTMVSLAHAGLAERLTPPNCRFFNLSPLTFGHS
ncbi:tRNA dimethylallyltransferase [Roseovarius pacificus]|uniref:tRNA (adenosine(37)-N6)-dimethylallyltransferase n=1 Tax=Roseovarius pacificus TaxID=337701 RepID=UPI002A188178|nr:tRNA dimethylallyltransferase [Roseovarius pacificus]